MTDEFRGSVRLGGKRESPDRSHSLPTGRVIFLDVAQEVVPEVLAALRTEVLPLYPGDEWMPEFECWCARFHVTDPWLKRCALDTLKEFATQLKPGSIVRDFWTGEETELQESDMNRWVPSSFSHHLPLPLSERWATVEGVEIDLGFHTRDKQLQRLRAPRDQGGAGLSADQARHEIAQVDAMYERREWVKPPTKKVRHFEWLALYQFGGWSVTRLAEIREDKRVLRDGYAKKARSTMTGAVCGTAALIGVTLRPPIRR